MQRLVQPNAFRGSGSLRSRYPGTGLHRRRLCVHAEVFQLGSSWVSAPSRRGPRKPRVKGVVHFLGGAFAGAAPQVVYGLLLDLLADAGYTVLATPYAVTFKHLECADTVRQQFLSAVQDLRSDSSTRDLAPTDTPLLGVGHSNGALMHLLIGSTQPGTTAGNVVISYNNKQVADAIPIPGFLSSVGPAVAALQSAPAPPLPLPEPAAVLRSMASLLPPALQLDAAGQISNAALAIEQVGTVLGEVGSGATDFTPSPAESRQLIQQGYDANRSPLLMIQFADDTIDETQTLAPLLVNQNPRGVSTLVLPGSHVTPCGGDIPWQAGPVFTPVDAIAQLAKLQTQRDVRRLADAVVDYLDTLSSSTRT